MSTSVLKALPGKPDIKRHSPSILYLFAGRLQQNGDIDLKKFVRFSTVVRRVEYHEASDDFKVISKNLITDNESLERFTHIIVATGIFAVPQLPSIEGLDEFPGRILHAHDFKNAEEFKGQKILVVGASYSAEDLALQTLKFGAMKVTTCWRTNPMGFKWPTGIDERPLVTKLQGKTAYFKDGSKDDYDSVLLCTGYKKYYPFLPDDLRLTGGLSLYPPNLYKGTVWLNGGNGKLLYLGTQDQYYTFTMFDVQALWACRYITAQVKTPPQKEMKEDAENWQEKVQKLKDCHDEIDFQTEFLLDLGKAVDYSEKAGSIGALFHEWEHHKYEDICTYRDKSFRSVFSGTLAPRHHTTWMEAKDDTYDTFVDQTPNKF